ncbi:MAG: serine/threonine protein kinase [Planctomycetota bacterium]|nr:MAG: serine/threonine protein kinase [Planctomycetota bacterium]
MARLGAGGMGEVYKAWDPTLRRWIALKILLRGAEEVAPWFQREARLAAQLHHPGLVAIHEVGEVDGRMFIAMQLVEGKTLDKLNGATREQRVRLLRDAAAAIGHAHQQGIVHRDLKPENLMVESSPLATGAAEPAWEHRICVLDFGVARAMGSALKLTAGWAAVGTPLYMSPEQSRGEAPEPASDVYSLGATLYEVLVGAPPIRGMDIKETIELIQEREPVPLRAIDPTIPEGLAAIVKRCLEKNPRDRYPNGVALAEDLDRFLGGESVSVTDRGRVWEFRKWTLRRRKRIAVISAIVAGVGLAGWFAVRSFERERASEDRARRLGGLQAVVSKELATAEACLAAGDAAGAQAAYKRGEQACGQELAAGELAEVRMVLAEVAFARGDADMAERELTRALEVDPGLRGARVLRGLARVRRRETLRRYHLSQIGGARLSPGPVMPPTIEDLEYSFPDLADLRQGAFGDLEFMDAAAGRLVQDQLDMARAARSQLDSNARGVMEALRAAVLRPRPSADLLAMAAIAALESGDAAGAQEYSARAVALWPGHGGGRLARAHVALACAGGEGTPGRDEHLLEASQAAEAAQSLGAEMPDSALIRGYADLARKEFAGAEIAFASAIAPHPDCVSALIGRAHARVGLGRTEDAALDFKEALRQLPDSSCLRKNIEEYLAAPPGR